jgi:hypothetical protein
MFWVGWCVFFLGAAGPARTFSDSFKLTVSIGDKDGRHIEPADRVFKVPSGIPTTFYVTATNTSSSMERLYEQAADPGYSSISFEISDEAGNTNVIRRKKDLSASGAVASIPIQPENKKVFEINLNEDEWENVFNLSKKGARRLRGRAVYENDFKKIYSEYYQLIIIDSKAEPIE